MTNDLPRRTILAFGLAALTACSTMDGPSPDAPPPERNADSAGEVIPAEPDYTPEQVREIADRVKTHPAALYSVARDAYTLYIGGRLTAVVKGGGGLDLIPDDPALPSCRYAADGRAIEGGNDETGCRRLLGELDGMLGTGG